MDDGLLKELLLPTEDYLKLEEKYKDLLYQIPKEDVLSMLMLDASVFEKKYNTFSNVPSVIKSFEDFKTHICALINACIYLNSQFKEEEEKSLKMLNVDDNK